MSIEDLMTGGNAAGLLIFVFTNGSLQAHLAPLRSQEVIVS